MMGLRGGNERQISPLENSSVINNGESSARQPLSVGAPRSYQVETAERVILLQHPRYDVLRRIRHRSDVTLA